jgi:hypothetical protein
VSISLPGLARFGCDLSATVGGIPNFGQTSSSQKLASKRCKEGVGQALSTDDRPRLWADGRPIISPGMSGIYQSNRQLRPYPWPRSPLAAIAGGPFAGAWNLARRDSSPSREELPANGHRRRNFECVPMWRFGNSRGAGAYGTNNRCVLLATIRLQRQLLLGRFGPPTLA